MQSTHPFSEETVNEAFRRVRNRLRKHFPLEIVTACINKLNEHPKDKIQHMRFYPPWRLLSLLKWTILYGDYLNPNRKHLDINSFNYLVNLMHDLSGKLRLPTQYENYFLNLRNMAFQQFWLQHDFNMAQFARQSLLFGKLGDKHPFNSKFLEKSGITITDFIELAMMLMTRFTVEKQRSVTLNWFRTVANKYESGTIQKFLNLLSIDFDSLRIKLSQGQRSNSKVSYEVYERSPLRETPLLKTDTIYNPFSPELLARSVETYIYDTLRSDAPGDFMNTFGLIFQKYVGTSISEIGVEAFDENGIRRIYPGPGKSVDYLLIHEGTKIFIDAKGVEMSYLGMVGHRPEIIENNAKDSIIKGIHQGFETARRLEDWERKRGIEVDENNNYLFLVTFKDMFLGNGLDFYQYVAKERLDKLIEDLGGRRMIPFEHMYFLSIDDFDLLMGGVASKEIDLKQMLEHVVKSDASIPTKKLSFEQHVYDKYPTVKAPARLIDESKHILDCCRLRFDSSKT